MRFNPFQFELPLARGREETAREQTSIGGTIVPYTLRRSTRRRSIALRIDEEGLRVAVPWNASRQAIHAALDQHADWIIGKLAEWQKKRAPSLMWIDGDAVMYLGETVRLRVEDGAGAPILRDGLLHVRARKSNPRVVEKRVTEWLKAAASRDYPARVHHFCSMIGTMASDIRLSSARSRWGSCHSNGCIRLNWRMIQTPPRLIDYVVAHEVAHLREMNHSPRFWALVESMIPDYRERRREMRSGGQRYLVL